MRPMNFSGADVVAGVSMAGLLLPEAVAYASIAGLPAQTGLAALFSGLIGFALFGRSRGAMVAATSSSAALLAAVTATLAHGDPAHRLMLAAALTLLTGLGFMLGAAAGLGRVSDFIAKPVLRGFGFGLACVIIVKQALVMVGLHTESGDFVHAVWALLSHASQWHFAGLGLGLAALALLWALARFPRLPGAALVMAAGIAVTAWPGYADWGISAVGPMDLHWAGFSWPELSKAEWMRLGELAFAMGLILYAESCASIRTVALAHGDALEPNRDMLALGVANVLSGLFQGLPVGAGYSATAANDAAGARSQVSGGVAALTSALVLLSVAPWLALAPQPVLAAVVVFAVGHTLRWTAFRPYLQWRRDRMVALAAVLAVLWLGVLDGLLAGIAVSLVRILQRMAEARVTPLGRLGDGHDFVSLGQHPEATPVPGLLILRPESPLFFANVERVMAAVRAAADATATPLRWVVLSLEESSDIDSACIEALADLARQLQGQGRGLLLARLKDPVEAVLRRAALPALPPEHLIALSVDDAVAFARGAPAS